MERFFSHIEVNFKVHFVCVFFYSCSIRLKTVHKFGGCLSTAAQKIWKKVLQYAPNRVKDPVTLNLRSY